MAATFEPIATTTLGSAAASISFTGISAAYTDLRLIVSAIGAAASCYVAIQFNGDTGTNYSYTQMRGDGSSATSGRGTSSARGFILNTSADLSTTSPSLSVTDIFSYAGSTYKTALSKGAADKNGSGETTAIVNLWRDTSAITRVDVIGYNANLGTGTTATLFGIKSA